MSNLRLIDERRYLELEKEKLEPEDRRFILTINHDEVLFNENMLLQNRILVIALFALFFAGLSLVLNIETISNEAKIWFVGILSIFSLFILIMLSRANKRVKIQNNKIKTNYDELFKYHLNYAKKKNDKKTK